MASLPRHLLGEIGLRLDDASYAQVVAALGCVEGQRAPGFVTWSWLQCREELEQLRKHGDATRLDAHRARWRGVLSEPGSRRLRIVDLDSDEPDLVELCRILGHPAVGSEALHAELRARRADLRWQWPLRIAALPLDFEALGITKLKHSWPSKVLAKPRQLSRDDARCEILISQGGVRELLRRLLSLPHRVRAGHLLCLAPLDVPWAETRSLADALLTETQAAALSIVAELSAKDFTERLNAFVELLSHDTPYDVALSRSFSIDKSLSLLDADFIRSRTFHSEARGVGAQLRRLPRSAPFSPPVAAVGRLRVGWAPGEAIESLARNLETAKIPTDHESEGAQGISEISEATRRARREAAHSEALRGLQANLFRVDGGQLEPEASGLTLGSPYRLDVFIGPLGEGDISADRPFDDSQLDWSQRDAFTLQVLFAEPEQWDQPLRGTLELPRSGRSSTCSFRFSPSRRGPFAGRVTILYRGRILQTALLRCNVRAAGAPSRGKAQPLHFAVEAQIRDSLSTLDERRRFDACLLLNRTARHKGALTAAGKDGAYIASLDGVAAQLARINELLTQVAHEEAKYSAGLTSRANAALFVSLARQGHLLHQKLVVDHLERSSAASALLAAEHLQIVSVTADEVVPLEFVYAYKPPKPGAPVCRNAAEALREGRCPASCVPRSSPAPHVCPMGFWGLSKVIERHWHDPNLPKAAKVTSEPIEGRNVLKLSGVTLLAASEQLSTRARNNLERDVKSSWGKVSSARSWGEWRRIVASKRPVLLIALPHADGTGDDISLEIGGIAVESLYIDESYVMADAAEVPPLVLLLGCDVTNVAYTDAYARHVAVFRRAKAALVLGTVATILATDGAKVTAMLVKRLAAARRSRECFGEALRDLKRAAVAQSLPMAICLAAFGDADWRLG